MMRATAIAIALSSSAIACSDEPYIELYVADERLPFLQNGRDFDALGVEARADGCANALVEYPPQDLPATVTVVAGDCYSGDLQLQAFASSGEKRVAESKWLALTLPDEGVLVATATLSSLPGPRVRFRTGFEPGDPIGGTDDQLFVVNVRDVESLVARADESTSVEGRRSILLSGTATSTNARVTVRAVATDLLVAPNDHLQYARRIDGGATPATMGIDVVLDSGRTAKELGLTDQFNAPVHPASADGRERDKWQRWIVDLSPAASMRLVGVLLGFDAREGGAPGDFAVRMDDLWIESR
jgi:hypothetical protein